VRVEVEISLDKFDIKALVSEEGAKKGFASSEDTFLWGVLSLQCQIDGSHDVTEEMCRNRRLITWLASTSYIILSFTLASVSAIVGILFLSSTPVVHASVLMTLYTCAIVGVLTTFLIYEIKLRHLMLDPTSWGIFDHHIHTTMAGIDAARQIPIDATYAASRHYPLAAIVLLICLCLLVISLLAFLVRYHRSLKRKSYAYHSAVAFERKRSILTPHAEHKETIPDDPTQMLKSRKPHRN
jgi:hypothetical protein